MRGTSHFINVIPMHHWLSQQHRPLNTALIKCCLPATISRWRVFQNLLEVDQDTTSSNSSRIRAIASGTFRGSPPSAASKGRTGLLQLDTKFEDGRHEKHWQPCSHRWRQLPGRWRCPTLTQLTPGSLKGVRWRSFWRVLTFKKCISYRDHLHLLK